MNEKLLMEIAHCPNVEKYFENKSADIPCKDIIKSQGVKSLKEFQLPEPWNGKIKTAPIMFLSSNPGIKPDEVFPTWSKGLWPDDRVIDFFTNRFGGGKKEWKDEDGKSLYNDGKYKGGAKFWGSIKNTVATIRRENKKKITLRDAAKHFSSTEIVHCKSKSEKGVRKSSEECAEKYLCRVLNISGAKVVVCYGQHVKEVLKNQLGISPSGHIYKDKTGKMIKRIYVFLPHPNARVKRKIEKVLNKSELTEVNQFAKKYCVAD
ncbi:MAG: hypothetical protein M1591_10485 [Deltaproteobacteria bacterium]|nr:hypothetical protein [Deltaproteobacteria bacterium]